MTFQFNHTNGNAVGRIFHIFHWWFYCKSVLYALADLNTILEVISPSTFNYGCLEFLIKSGFDNRYVATGNIYYHTNCLQEKLFKNCDTFQTALCK